jgi:hypothetical protein
MARESPEVTRMAKSPPLDGLKRRINRHRQEMAGQQQGHFVRETYRLSEGCLLDRGGKLAPAGRRLHRVYHAPAANC